MKKIIMGIVIVILIVFVILFLSTGGARTDAHLRNFKLSEDGKTMTINVDVSSSAGYIRDMKQTSGSMNYYLTFYSTFGINSKLGAKDTFTLDIDQNVDEIYFYTGGKGYKRVLEKNEQGEWINVDGDYENYQHISTLEKNAYASTEILVKFDGIVYGKSNAIIDYEGGTEKIGVIDKLIDKELVPSLDNETNTKELLNAEVYNKTEDSIVLFYNNEYVLFGKVSE